KRLGLDMYMFDPFYHNNSEYLNHKYNLITTTEVAEHFFNPMKEFEHLSGLLAPGGYLVIMTSFRTMPIEDFTNWWYRRDATHVSFYTEDTLNFIANKYNLKVVNSNNKNITVMYKEKTSA
ncbi:MAG: class I SAM-dependent methyltransferase, partial [Candidatus Izemoplasma sp.]